MTENERVRAVRKAKKLTLEQFGAVIGMSRSTISDIENGNRSVTRQTHLSICREFGVREEWLNNGEGEMFAELDRSEEIAGFLGDVMRDNNSFRARFISMLSRLTPDEWGLLEQMAEKLSQKTKKDDPEGSP